MLSDPVRGDLLGPRMGPDETKPVDASTAALLAGLMSSLSEGLALVDGAGRYLFANRCFAEMFGVLTSDVAGVDADPQVLRTAQLSAERSDEGGQGHPLLYVRTPRREVQCEGKWLHLHGTRVLGIVCRDVSSTRQHERRLAAFSRTAANIAYAGSLENALDQLAEEVRHATGIAACMVILIDRFSGDMRHAGGAGYPSDFVERMEACRQLGMPSVTFEAFNTAKPVVAPHWGDAVRNDPRFAPMHEVLNSEWDGYVAVPLLLHEEAIGVLTGFYVRGHDPNKSDIAFLCAMADQAAIAVENARLISQLRNQAAIEERSRLARDLHDSIVQALFSLVLHAGALEMTLAGKDFDDSRQEQAMAGVSEIRALAKSTLAEMRALIIHIRQDALHDDGLVTAIRRHANAVSGRSGLRLVVEASDESVSLTREVEVELFYTVQEALQNVVKHAQARCAVVRFECSEDASDELRVHVEDDGKGFDVNATTAADQFGLRGMRERMSHVGGSLSIRSHVGGPTCVTARVPTKPSGGSVRQSMTTGGAR